MKYKNRLKKLRIRQADFDRLSVEEQKGCKRPGSTNDKK